MQQSFSATREVKIVSSVLSRRLRIAAVAELCGGINQSTVYRWMEYRQFPRPMKLGRKIALWDEQQVEAWLKTHAEELQGGVR